MLTDETIRRHLQGEITVGLYAINPSTQRCKWVAIDADYKNANNSDTGHLPIVDGEAQRT